ncbi:MAG: cysteine desulfurase [Treponema sp.]|jgi:cysteine desulfurase/selenocysteine lyase|nr:cysteine desulfurase [Treponema sp.]
MITASELNPASIGLPSEEQIASWAQEYFPEYREAGKFVSLQDGVQDAFVNERPAFSPAVVSHNEAKNTFLSNHAVSAADSQNARQVFAGGRSIEAIRADFPILSQKVDGKDLVWLDNGATTQKPRQVIDRLSYFYENENSNVHRGAHTLAARATDAYEAARQTTANFLGAPSPENIVFVRGTTEAINLAANAYVKPLLNPGDEIILTLLEHHANIVPWQLIAEETGALIRVVPVDSSGQLIMSEYEKLFNRNTKFVSATHVSNALGTITPVYELVQIAHSHGVRILIDGAQSVSHIPVNVTSLDPDFYVFSGHKIFAPTGIGALYGKADALEQAVPYQGGGNMIADVTFERTIYNPPPSKFEAGTGNIADAAGLGAALDYVSSIGLQNIFHYEHELLQYATKELTKIKGLKLIGTAAEKASVLSFVLDGHSVPDIGKYLSSKGIAVRAGHHCAQPILRHFGLEATVRPTLALYNNYADVDALVRALRELTGSGLNYGKTGFGGY